MMEKYNYRKDPHQDIDHVFRDLLPAHGMVERPAQVELSHQMLDAMLNGSIALCDAGTGIGKTYAYLVAGVVFRRYRSRAGLPNQPLLISTSSIALQGAIIHDYLPFLSKVMMADGMLDSPLRAVLRKGKSHYVCDARLMKRLQTANLDRKNPLAKAALLSMRDHLDLDMAPHLSGYDRERICVPPTCDCGKTECRYLCYLDVCASAIINTDTFERVQKLKERRTRKRQLDKQDSPLRGKMACGVCGTALMRRTTGKGLISWVCRKHDENAADCPVGRIPETEIYAAFVRMYNKIRANADIVLKPALTQLDDLERALQRENPAMLEINRAIAQVAEQSHNISKLQTAGLLDADACAAKLSSIQIKLTQLRRERRRLLEHDDIEDAISRLHQTADTIKSGPEQLDTFDESLFEELVERIIAESQTCIRFRLWGGVELTEEVRRAKR